MLGERNPNLKLDGLPVLYIPLGFCRGPASFSNLADFMVEFWSDPFSWLSVAVVLS